VTAVVSCCAGGFGECVDVKCDVLSLEDHDDVDNDVNSKSFIIGVVVAAAVVFELSRGDRSTPAVSVPTVALPATTIATFYWVKFVYDFIFISFYWPMALHWRCSIRV